MRKLLLAFTAFVCATTNICAQSASDNNELKVLPPSPSIAEIGRYGLASANLSDGAFATQIPIYEYKTKNLTLPITLAYSTNGLKVDKVASRVGTDWNLMAGGSIGRMVLGKPDEWVTWANPPAGFPSATGQAVNSYVNSAANGNSETVPDVYNFSFNGYSGRFLYYNGQIVKLEQNSLIIQKTAGGFSIVDNNGIKYIFNDTEESLTSSSCAGNPYQTTNWITNAWLLSAIIHPSGDQISFKYKPCTFSYASGVSQTYISALEGSSDPYCTVCPTNKPVSTKCTSTIQNHGLLLDKISSNYRGVVQFSYQPRLDLTGDSAISEIKVYDATLNTNNTLNYFKTDPIRTFGFEYQFVNGISGGNSGGTNTDKRMYLTNYYETDNGSNGKVYGFTYNKLNEIPKRLAFSQDHYGYFNGKNNNSLIPAPANQTHYNRFDSYGYGNRLPDWTYSQKGCLSKISYPTGGTDSIVYEPHTVSHGAGTYDCNNLNVTTEIMADGNSEFKKTIKYYSDVFTVHCQQTVTIEVANIPIISDYPSSNYGTFACLIAGDGEVIPPNPTCTGSWQAAMNQWNTSQLTLMPGTYRLQVSVKGPARGYAKFTYSDNNDGSGNVSISGIRVKKVITKTHTSAIPIERKYYYSGVNSTASSGITVNENPWYNSLLHQYVNCNGSSACVPVECQYTQYFSDNFYSLYAYGGNHIYYTTVTEDLGNNFENGYIEHNFSVAHDVNASPITGTLARGTPLSSFGILNGREYLTKFYKNTGSSFQLLKQVRNTYESDSRLHADNKFYSFQTDPGFATCSNAASVYDFLGLHVAEYNLLTRWIYVDSTIVSEYNDDGTEIKNITTYDYSNPGHQQVTTTKTFDSKGQANINYTFYPTDGFTYTTDAGAVTAKTALENLHIYATPLQSLDYVGANLVKEVENHYSTTLMAAPALSKTYEALNGSAKDLKIEITKYGTGGTILDAKLKGSNLVSYLWDYKEVLPIAQVTNALSADIAYSSFEADGNGSWTGISAGSISSDPFSVTGTKYYNLSGGSASKTGLNSASSYIVSYWSKNGSYSVSGTQTGWPKQLRTVTLNGQTWTYYEHLISGVTSTTVSGSGVIDELRLYPSTAQMITYAYDPLVGLISQCDANNRIQYYTYDGLGRLLFIKDENKNILKKYCYNYAGQIENCSVAAIWQNTGTTRCKPCQSSSSYTTNILQDQQKDVNPESPTYGQFQWADAGVNGSCVINADWQNTATAIRCKTVNGSYTGEQEREQQDVNPCSPTYNQTQWIVIATNCATCPKAANWQSTGNVRCVKNGSNQNTGYQEREEKDMETCSATYNQLRWVANGYNTTACPLPYICTNANCTGVDKRCVNNNCETGMKVYTSSVWNNSMKMYLCTYHYEWSDGSWSQNYTEYNKWSCQELN
jgi:hypothetical protein